MQQRKPRAIGAEPLPDSDGALAGLQPALEHLRDAHSTPRGRVHPETGQGGLLVAFPEGALMYDLPRLQRHGVLYELVILLR